MIGLRRILKDYADSGALSALVGIHAAIDDCSFLTKSGHLITMLALNGPDAECREVPELEQITRRFEGALRVFGEDCRVYQYLIRRQDATIPARSYENPIVQEAIRNRVAYLESKAELCSLETVVAVSYEAWTYEKDVWQKVARLLRKPLGSLRESLSVSHKADILEGELNEAQQILANKVASFVVQLPEGIRARCLDKQQVFRFLRGLLNYAPDKAEAIRLKYDRYVDFQLCDSVLECYPDHLRMDDSYVRVVTLKEPPAQTFAHLWRELHQVPCDMIVTTEWKRAGAMEMRKLIHSKRRHFHNKKSSLAASFSGNGSTGSGNVLIDDSAVATVAELGSCLEELDFKGRSFGEFSLTIVLYGRDPASVNRAVAQCTKVFGNHDAQLTEERYNALNAWLAILPGNSAYNLRKLWILDTNYADSSFLFSQDQGNIENPHLGAEYLTIFETNHQTPYFFNLHHLDIAHAAVFGATGKGKSFLMNFLLLHLQKYKPLTYIFDLGGSYENLARLFGGAYLPIGVEKRPFTINPFALPTPENLHFLFVFLKVLIESETFHMSAEDDRDLYEQIENLYAIEPSQRRLLTLANMLKRPLRKQLEKWTEGGPYASVFDNGEDNLTFASFQTFDFEGMDKHREVLEPLLFYILHRATAAITDPTKLTTFKVFVIDEAWRFFRHPTIRLYIMEALKTWRKKNSAMILVTQSNEDLFRSEMLPIVVESCPTKMFLANPDMDRTAYREMFHLNETEADLIAGLVPKQQILIKRPEGSKVVNLNVSPKDYWLFTSDPNDRQLRDEIFAKHGFTEGLEILVSSTLARRKSS